MPIIGHISLAKDMKAALQEEEESEESIQRDAKGREILSPEEKARRDEKARKVAAEVRCDIWANPPRADFDLRRKRRFGLSAYRNSWRTWTENFRYSRSRLLMSTILK